MHRYQVIMLRNSHFVFAGPFFSTQLRKQKRQLHLIPRHFSSRNVVTAIFRFLNWDESQGTEIKPQWRSEHHEGTFTPSVCLVVSYAASSIPLLNHSQGTLTPLQVRFTLQMTFNDHTEGKNGYFAVYFFFLLSTE